MNNALLNQQSNGNKNLSNVIQHIQDKEPGMLKLHTNIDNKSKQRRYSNNVSLKSLNEKKSVKRYRSKPEVPVVTAYDKELTYEKMMASKIREKNNKVNNIGNNSKQPVNKDEDMLSKPAEINRGDIEATPEKQSIYQKFAFMVMVTALFGIMLVLKQLDVRIDEVNESLYSYEDQVIETSDAQKKTSEMMPSVSKLGSKLDGLISELQFVKTDYKKSDSLLASNISDNYAPQFNEIVATKKSISTLREELERVQRETLEIKDAMETIKTNTSSTQVKTTSGKWLVNLASLSDMEKVKIAVNRLQEYGLDPVVDEAVVNGVKIYRLSIAGFETRNEAMVFINTAKYQYGFENGWIRPG